MLELSDGGGGGLLAEVGFEGLMPAFDFSLGGGVVGGGVDLGDVECGQELFEVVGLAVVVVSCGEAGGVDHAVVGECGGG